MGFEVTTGIYALSAVCVYIIQALIFQRFCINSREGFWREKVFEACRDQLDCRFFFGDCTIKKIQAIV